MQILATHFAPYGKKKKTLQSFLDGLVSHSPVP